MRLAFELGIDHDFLDPEFNQYIDRIPDISALLNDDNKDTMASAGMCLASPKRKHRPSTTACLGASK